MQALGIGLFMPGLFVTLARQLGIGEAAASLSRTGPLANDRHCFAD